MSGPHYIVKGEGYAENSLEVEFFKIDLFCPVFVGVINDINFTVYNGKVGGIG